jgi:hypothetical protein
MAEKTNAKTLPASFGPGALDEIAARDANIKDEDALLTK